MKSQQMLVTWDFLKFSWFDTNPSNHEISTCINYKKSTVLENIGIINIFGTIMELFRT